MPAERYVVEFEPAGRRIDVPAGASLLEASRQAGIGLASVCGGDGTCGRCRVVVLEGITPPAAPAERRALSGSELAAGQRLACRVPVVSGMKVDVPKASLITGQRLQLAGPAGAALIDAAVRSLPVHAEPPTLRDQRSDFDRLAAAAAITHGVRRLRAGPDVLRQLTPLARRTGWELLLLVRGDEVIGALAPGRRVVGLAIDLGTTKIAGYLLDFGTGAELAADGLMNPQIAYGEDVVSRLAHAVRTEHGADDLARVVREGIDALVGTLCRQAGVERDAVGDGCVVANTAMHHLLLGLPTRQLAAAPFVAATSAPVDVQARDLGLDLAPAAGSTSCPTSAGSSARTTSP